MLAASGHMVYAGMRSHEQSEITAARKDAEAQDMSLQPIIMDVTNTESVNSAVTGVLSDLKARFGKESVDVVIHNAGHGSMGPSEAFSADELMAMFNVNVIGAQRLNRAVLPHMRRAGKGLLMWTSSTSTRGGTPPFLGPYFCAKAAMDSLAVTYSGELAKWGIETTIVVPGAFTTGTKHFENMSKPRDEVVVEQYFSGPYKGMSERVVDGLTKITPADADPEDVAREMVRIVNLPYRQRPFRTHVDPCGDGAEEVSRVADANREQFLRRIGVDDILTVG
jgi:NAD(P)-dependent dehydrogenase (short-subunit alcohol dehydrogenase family)